MITTTTGRLSCKKPHLANGLRKAAPPPPKVLSAPLTRQGVRNLDSAAPAHLRNGRKFRRPKNYEVICEHPVESRDPMTHTRTVAVTNEFGDSSYEQDYEICLDCGAEVNA